jgi:hypothetical protein
VSTFLTSADGEEIYESCSAAVIAWDGARFVLAPSDRPRVDSTAERALRGGAEWVTAPVLRHGSLPLALVNAVAGICLPSVEGRPPFPAAAQEIVAAIFTASIRRP